MATDLSGEKCVGILTVVELPPMLVGAGVVWGTKLRDACSELLRYRAFTRTEERFFLWGKETILVQQNRLFPEWINQCCLLVYVCEADDVTHRCSKRRRRCRLQDGHALEKSEGMMLEQAPPASSPGRRAQSARWPSQLYTRGALFRAPRSRFGDLRGSSSPLRWRDRARE